MYLQRHGLTTCDRFRSNRTHRCKPPISPSIAPLDIHKYVFGCESWRNRLLCNRFRSAAAPKPVALAISGRARRVALPRLRLRPSLAPAVCRRWSRCFEAGHPAILPRRIRLRCLAGARHRNPRAGASSYRSARLRSQPSAPRFYFFSAVAGRHALPRTMPVGLAFHRPPRSPSTKKN